MLRTHPFVSASRHAVWGLALAFTWLCAAAPAHADSDFENAFERSLGSVLAYEVVQAGKAVLYGAPVAVPVRVPVAAPVYYAPPVAYAVPVVVPVPVAVPYPYPVYGYGYAPHHHHNVKVVHKTVVKRHYRGGHGGRGHHDRDRDHDGRYARR